VLQSVFEEIERDASKHHEAMNAGNSQNDLFESTIPALSSVVGLLGGLVASYAVYKLFRWVLKRKLKFILVPSNFYCNESNSFFVYSGWRISKVVNMTDTAAGSMESSGWKNYNLGDEVTNEEV